MTTAIATPLKNGKFSAFHIDPFTHESCVASIHDSITLRQLQELFASNPQIDKARDSSRRLSITRAGLDNLLVDNEESLRDFCYSDRRINVPVALDRVAIFFTSPVQLWIEQMKEIVSKDEYDALVESIETIQLKSEKLSESYLDQLQVCIDAIRIIDSIKATFRNDHVLDDVTVDEFLITFFSYLTEAEFYCKKAAYRVRHVWQGK